MNLTRRVLLHSWMIPVTWSLVAVVLLVYGLYAYAVGLVGEIRKEIRWRRRGVRARLLVVRRTLTYRASTNNYDMTGKILPGLVSESYLVATIGRDAVGAALRRGDLEETGIDHYVEPWSNTYTARAWP